MPPDAAAVFGIRLAIITVGVVAGAVYLLQRRLSPVYGMSSFMFMAFVASQLFYVVDTLWPGLPQGLHHGMHMLSYVAAFLLLPTFFIHLKFLARAPEAITRRDLAIHLTLPVTVFLLALATLAMPVASVTALKTGLPAPEAGLLVRATVETLLLLEFGGYGFVLVYIWLLFRWQKRNGTRMRAVFASGEGYEPFWTVSLATVLALFVAQALVSFFLRDGGLGHPVGPIEHSVIALLFILLVAIRGLRQAPGLYGSMFHEDVPRPAAPKYSKSALAAEHADRIARKLNAAMAESHLHRDASLSLTKLAQHIGSSPNYVSQTLNEHMAQSFFDFVNAWRIREAETRLLDGNDTILAIAYEVGFNSRSAFYTAFKKHAGMTPSDYRARQKSVRSEAPSPGSMSRTVQP